MKPFWIVLMLFVVGMSGISLMAQDTEAPDLCARDVLDEPLRSSDSGTIWQALEVIRGRMDTDVYEDNMADYLEMARLMKRVLSIFEARCRGFYFTSETDGQQPVLGPIMFPDGIWKAIITVDGVASVEVETLAGTCDPDSGSLFTAVQGDGTEGAETIYKTSDDCEALMSVSDVSGDWTLIFVPIKLDDDQP